MQLGNRDANPVRLARLQALNNDAGNTRNWEITEDVDEHSIPRRIRIRYLTIHSSNVATYTLRIFTRASRSMTPGGANYSLIYSRTVTASDAISIDQDEIDYVDEDATADSYDSSLDSGEYKAQIYVQILTTAGNNTAYELAIVFTQ